VNLKALLGSKVGGGEGRGEKRELAYPKVSFVIK